VANGGFGESMIKVEESLEALNEMRKRIERVKDKPAIFEEWLEEEKRKMCAKIFDNYAKYKEREYERMLDEEKTAKAGGGLGKIVMGIIALAVSSRDPILAGELVRDELYGVIRILDSKEGYKVANVSKIARKRKRPIESVIEELEARGCKVIGLEDFKKIMENAKSEIQTAQMSTVEEILNEYYSQRSLSLLLAREKEAKEAGV
jgi:predicted metal-binding protein